MGDLGGSASRKEPCRLVACSSKAAAPRDNGQWHDAVAAGEQWSAGWRSTEVVEQCQKL
jgi:hypothetical protein